MKGLDDGKKIPQQEQNTLLIQQLNDTLNSTEDYTQLNKDAQFLNGPRSCHYVCAMVLYLGPDRLYIVQDTMEGSLVENIGDARGNGGFGYDPLFVLPDGVHTAAELTDDEKNSISHRGKAARLLKEIVKNIPEIK